MALSRGCTHLGPWPTLVRDTHTLGSFALLLRYGNAEKSRNCEVSETDWSRPEPVRPDLDGVTARSRFLTSSLDHKNGGAALVLARKCCGGCPYPCP